MEQLWEKKWKSFKKTEVKPKKVFRKKKTVQYKEGEENILRPLSEELINELTEDELDKVSHIVKNVNVDNLSFDNIFQGKKRIVLPFSPGPTEELEALEKFLSENEYSIDWQNGLSSKEIETRQGKQVRKSKIGKLLSKFISFKEKFNKTIDDAYQIEKNVGAIQRKKQQELIVDPKFIETQPDKSTWGLSTSAMDKAEELLKDDPEIKKLEAEGLRLLNQKDEIEKRMRGDFPKPSLNAQRAKNLLKFWNEKSDFYRKNPQTIQGEDGIYSLVVTRAPIDVLRMSDFEKITSCHSPPNRGRPNGGGFYKCAVAEANGHGPIVYVVKNSDIPEDFDWQQPEVFSDEHRDIEGPTPISRVRIRKYTGGGKELAIPEKSTYGKRFPTLVSSVTDFLRKAQPEIMENKPESVREFTRHGGSKADSTDGTLFNNFFGSSHFSGNAYAEYEEEEREEYEEEEEDLEAAWQDQCEGIDNQYNEFDYAHAHYEVEDDGEDINVVFSGGISFEFDENISDAADTIGWREESKISSEIESKISVSHGEITVEVNRNNIRIIRIQIDADRSDVGPDPDGYEEFLRYNVNELDNNYDEILEKLEEILLNNDILIGTHFHQTKKKIKEEDFNFEHFVADIDSDGDISIESYDEDHIEINVTPLVSLIAGSGDKLSLGSDTSKEHEAEILKKWARIIRSDEYREQFWEKVVGIINSLAKQLEFPSLANEEEPEFGLPLDDFNLEPAPGGNSVSRAGYSHPWVGKTYFGMTITSGDDTEEIIATLKILKYIDENYDKIEDIAQSVFDDILKSVIQKHKTSQTSELSELLKTENLVEQIIKDIKPKKRIILKIGNK